MIDMKQLRAYLRELAFWLILYVYVSLVILETMRQWVELAHSFQCGVHVGRIGAPDKMILAHLAGVDSIDSTTWVQRNGSLEHHVREYREKVGV